MSEDNKHKQDNATVEAVAENELLLAIKSGNRVDIANTYISDIIQEKDLKNKKSDDITKTLNLMQQLQNFEDSIKDLLDKLKETRIQMEKAAERIKNLNHLKGDFDLQEFQLLMKTEYNKDVSHLNEKEAKDVLNTQLSKEKSDFDRLKDKYNHINKNLNDKLNDPLMDKLDPKVREELEAEYKAEALKKIKDLTAQAKHDGINTEKALVDVRIDNKGSSSLLNEARADIREDELDNYAHTNNLTSNDDPFASFNNESTTSFASTVSDDPFSEKASSIKDPFNEVANGMNIQPKQNIALNTQPQEPVIKSDIGLG
ncbi:hypothetical protein ACSIGC_08180 [Tenacibaculum sp. ZS6-P6]|uniref:hypothetical protein n=1 Tax=Tenacibaculum sp. ZS6-P6 TaxID=3447503 RepID=UPI003F98E189